MSGKVERGSVQKGDSVLLLPGNGDDVASVKGLQVHGKAAQAAFVGDMVEMGLSGLEHDVRTRAYRRHAHTRPSRNTRLVLCRAHS